ncbi:MAG TPA: YdbH domain-containing protein [Caulobacteraceae bacterium]|nr:YdbH domain-containing protein [Caulobacteraceae bacterium]
MVASLAIAALVLIVWTLVAQRFALARWAAEAWLRERGVEALVDIRTLDLGHFTGAIRLGDPRRPALKVERLEVDYTLEGPLNGKPFGLRTRTVRLIRPQLTAHFERGQLSFGVLQPIIDEALRRPVVGPSPAVLIRQGGVLVATPAGPIAFSGDADLANGALTRLDGRITALALRSGAGALTSTGGPVWARTSDGVLSGGASLDLTAAGAPGLSIGGGSLSVTVRTAYPRPRDGRLDGTGDFTLALTGATARSGAMRVQRLDAKASLPGVSYGWDGRSLALNGGAVIEARAGQLTGSGFAARSVWSALRLTGAASAASGGGLTASGETSGSFLADQMTTAGAPLAHVVLGGDGSIKAGSGNLVLDLQGRGAAVSAISPAQAVRIAAGAPILSGESAYRQALARALPGARLTAPGMRLALGPSGLRLTLLQPARAEARSGARLTLTPRGGAPIVEVDASGGVRGTARLSLAGGGLPDLDADIPALTVRGRETRAEITLAAALDYGPARGIKTTAHAHATASDAGFRLTLAECAPLSIARLEGGEKDVVGIEARVCPESAPLVAARRGAWIAQGEVRQASGLIEVLDARARDLAATFQARGGAQGLAAADVRIAGGELVDAETPVRFEPVRAGGTARLAGDLWRAELDLAPPRGPTLGHVSLRHDLTSGAGEARIEAPALVFAKDGLQPAAISPLASLIAGAQGTAAFQGDIAWTRQGMTSAGRLTASDFTFTSPIGEAHGLAADIGLASLIPLATLPDQSLAIARIDAFTPLTDVVLRFDYAGDTLNLTRAEAVAAKGRIGLEPMRVPVGREGAVSGVVTLKEVDLGELIATSTLADSVKLDAVVDGRLPFDLDAKGLRFTEGRLDAIRPGRISISRAALTKVASSAPQTPAGEINAVQDFAYQAMENLSFETLSAQVASRTGGRLGVVFQIKGKHDPAKPEQANISLIELIRGRAFNKRIPLPAGTPINLTLDTSLNFDELWDAFQDVWRAKQARSGAVQGR